MKISIERKAGGSLLSLSALSYGVFYKIWTSAESLLTFPSCFRYYLLGNDALNAKETVRQQAEILKGGGVWNWYGIYTVPALKASTTFLGPELTY